MGASADYVIVSCLVVVQRTDTCGTPGAPRAGSLPGARKGRGCTGPGCDASCPAAADLPSSHPARRPAPLTPPWRCGQIEVRKRVAACVVARIQTLWLVGWSVVRLVGWRAGCLATYLGHAVRRREVLALASEVILTARRARFAPSPVVAPLLPTALDARPALAPVLADDYFHCAALLVSRLLSDHAVPVLMHALPAVVALQPVWALLAGVRIQEQFAALLAPTAAAAMLAKGAAPAFLAPAATAPVLADGRAAAGLAHRSDPVMLTQGPPTIRTLPAPPSVAPMLAAVLGSGAEQI